MAILNITRLPGENEADFQRRYCREKMRIYRARKPKGPKHVRGKNKRPPKNSPHTAEEWAAMQSSPGESQEEWKLRSARERVARYRKRHAERLRAERLAKYPEIREAEIAQGRAFAAAHPEVIKARGAKHYRANKEKRLSVLSAWKAAHPQRMAEIKARWYEENRAIRNAYSAAWRKACRIQTPLWSDWEKIKAVYEEAIRIAVETGIEHHVDHIIPLRGKHVSGLHVHTNLQVIPAIDNMRKHNKLIVELAESVYAP